MFSIESLESRQLLSTVHVDVPPTLVGLSKAVVVPAATTDLSAVHITSTAILDWQSTGTFNDYGGTTTFVFDGNFSATLTVPGAEPQTLTHTFHYDTVAGPDQDIISLDFHESIPFNFDILITDPTLVAVYSNGASVEMQASTTGMFSESVNVQGGNIQFNQSVTSSVKSWGIDVNYVEGTPAAPTPVSHTIVMPSPDPLVSVKPGKRLGQLKQLLQ